MKRTLLFLICVIYSVLATAKVTIEMEKEGGVYKVPCIVNGLRMRFIFDTGAANVCISETMANYMLENDYLQKEDIIGTGQSSVADGRIVDHVKIKLATIEIGGLKLNDVEAVVITGQSAPLLLGQSAIRKMGKISIIDSNLIIESMNDCTDENIQHWTNLADSYYSNRVYDEAIKYYLKLYDCNVLSDYGIYVLADCYYSINQIDKAKYYLKILEQKTIEGYELSFAADYSSLAMMYSLIGSCYVNDNKYASIKYNKRALEYALLDNDMNLATNYYLIISIIYMSMEEMNKAYENADAGFRTRLEYKYPAVFEYYKKNINKLSLLEILEHYRWGQDELLGDLLFVMSMVYFRQYGVYPDPLIKIAAKMGSSMAADFL